jgi:hypothetical protein
MAAVQLLGASSPIRVRCCVVLCRFSRVSLSVSCMSFCRVRVMGGSFVFTGFVVPGSFLMVFGSCLVVMRRLLMVLRALVIRHSFSPFG